MCNIYIYTYTHIFLYVNISYIYLFMERFQSLEHFNKMETQLAVEAFN